MTAEDTTNRNDACCRRFIEASDRILLIELDRDGRIVRTNSAALRTLSDIGPPEGQVFAQFVLGLESADLSDLAAQFSHSAAGSGSIVELGGDGGSSSRYLFRAERSGDGLVLFGEPSSTEARELRREIASLRGHFSDAMRERGRQSLERREIMSALEEAQRQLERHARTDPVTGLSNRRGFMESIRREFQRYKRYGRRYSVALAEVRGLEDLTGCEGMSATEAAVVMVGELFRIVLRGSDHIARFADQQFAVMQCETSGDSACLVARRLRAAVLKQKITVPGGNELDLALGVTEALPADEHPEQTLRRASAALRLARETGTDVRLNL